MLNTNEFESLKSLIISSDAQAWHWHGKEALFDRVKDAIHRLHRANDPRASELYNLLKSRADDFSKSGFKDVGDAILRLLGAENLDSGKHSGVWSVPDVPFEFYSDISDENLQLPDAVSFALSQGEVSQSAREAVVYRLLKGKDDFNYYYSTRTVAIYFREGDGLFVAFDDDAFDNILLSRAEEGRNAGGDWLVSVGDPLVRAAISRAKGCGRVVQVTNEHVRSDSVKVAEAIIGDKAEEYAGFVKKHLNLDFKSYVINVSDCRGVSAGRALLRLVGLGYVGYCTGSLVADYRCDYGRRARGVRKISIGNEGWLVPYIGMVCFKKLGFIRSNDDISGIHSLLSYFQAAERQIPSKKSATAFYAGLGAVLGYIKSQSDLDSAIKILISIVKQADSELDDLSQLFSGLPLHKKLMRGINDLLFLALLYLRVLKRTPKQAMTIFEDIKTLIDAGLVTSTAKLSDVDSYLSEFQFLTPDRYKHYLSLDPQMRKEYLRNHKKKYLAIALGEQLNITPEDYDLIWYAVNSKNLTKDIIQKTLQRFGKEASKLPSTQFKPFDIKDLSEISGYKTNNLKKEFGTLLATISMVLLEENYPYSQILKMLGMPGKEMPKETLALTQMQNIPMNDEILQLTYKNAYAVLKNKNYLYDIAWILAVKYTADNEFGEDQKRELTQASKLSSLNYDHPSKSEAEALRSIYNRYTELYNDTIKHHFNDKKFLETIHKPKSQIMSIGKEMGKIVPVQNKSKIFIKCIPSKAPLDLFYGYYGENCTSSYPQELFDEPFVPVRIIQMTNGEPTIEGCIHFYATNYQDKKILAILGVEPRGDFTNKNDPEKLFSAINEAIEQQAKQQGFDYVCYPENATMHSNRGEIASKIAELIRNRKILPINIHFPRDHSSYTTRALYITWER